jgi:hypothetical protein
VFGPRAWALPRGQRGQLQDSFTALEAEKARAYEAGYREAYAGYQELNARYVAELNRPRVSLGSTVGLCVGVEGAGVLAGLALHDCGHAVTAASPRRQWITTPGGTMSCVRGARAAQAAGHVFPGSEEASSASGQASSD